MERGSPAPFSPEQAAKNFLLLVVKGKIRDAYSTYVHQDMRHHNPGFAGDATSLEKGMQENQDLFPDKVFEIKRTVHQGDTVAVHSHICMKAGDPGIAVVHIFRFRGERIIEMWDIAQPVPAESPNKNGMF